MNKANAFIQINEIVSGKIEQHKKAVLSDAEFSGLTLNLLMYIEAVYGLENPSLVDVAKSLHVSSASASIAVQKLIDTGFVKKKQSDSDKRVFHIEVTQKGEDLIRAQKVAMNAFWGGFMSTLSPDEQSILEDLLEKIYISQRMHTA